MVLRNDFLKRSSGQKRQLVSNVWASLIQIECSEELDSQIGIVLSSLLGPMDKQYKFTNIFFSSPEPKPFVYGLWVVMTIDFLLLVGYMIFLLSN